MLIILKSTYTAVVSYLLGLYVLVRYHKPIKAALAAFKNTQESLNLAENAESTGDNCEALRNMRGWRE